MNISELRSQVAASITEEECVELIKELVPAGQPEAENPLDPDLPSGREEGYSLLMAEKLKEMGLEVELRAGCEGRPNVIGKLKGKTDNPSLILNGHLDTYPAGDPSEWNMTDYNPYKPTIHGRYIYGRGTSDTRGNTACQLIAIRAIQRAGIELNGDLIMAYTVDEEGNGYAGSRFLLEEIGLKGDYEITAEPTSWERGKEWGLGVAVAHCGHCILEVETKGVKSHIWRPDVGINPLIKMSKLLLELEKLEFTHTPPKLSGPIKPSVCVVRVTGGKPGETQFVPNTCRARIVVVGVVPGMTKESILNDINGLIERMKQEDQEFEANVEVMKGYTFIPGIEEVSDDAAHLGAIRNAYREVLNQDLELYRKNGFCDTIQFSLHGIPAITFGPGEDGWSPINECIHIDKVIAATKVYALAVMELLGVNQGEPGGRFLW